MGRRARNINAVLARRDYIQPEMDVLQAEADERWVRATAILLRALARRAERQALASDSPVEQPARKEMQEQ